MEFKCLGSSSSGNAYVIKDSDENCLLVECGFKYDKLIQKLHKNDIRLVDICGVLVTHEHSDHAKSLNELKEINIKTFTPFVDETLKTGEFGNFIITPFPVRHDVPAYGFVIANKKEKQTILFINDTTDFQLCYLIQKEQFDYIFIECNHTYRKLTELLENAPDDKKFKYERQRDNHLSLIGTKKMLNQLDLTKTKGIYLMHLSTEASEPKVMKLQINFGFKKPTFICLKEGGII